QLRPLLKGRQGGSEHTARKFPAQRAHNLPCLLALERRIGVIGGRIPKPGIGVAEARACACANEERGPRRIEMSQLAGGPQVLEEEGRIEPASAAQLRKLLPLLRPLRRQDSKALVPVWVRRQQTLVVCVPVQAAIRTAVWLTRARRGA